MLPLVVRVEREDGRKHEFAFAESPVRIGRSPLNHVRLEDAYISRIQAVVRFDRDEINYFNVGRTNLTVVDDREIDANEEIKLAESSVVAVGSLQMRFAREAVAKERLTRPESRIPRSSDATEAQDLESTVAVHSSTGELLEERSIEKPIPPQPSRTPTVETKPRTIDATAAPSVVAVTRSRFIDASQRPHAVTKPKPQPSSSPKGVNTTKAKQLPVAPQPEPRPQLALSQSNDPSSCYSAYRQTWSELLRSLKTLLENCDSAARPQLATRLQKDFPQIVREPDFRKLLKSLDLIPRKPDSPELEEWLSGLSKGLFPKGLNLASGMTIERIIRVLEVFTQVFVEIQAAQNEARRQLALQSSGTGSLLSSEDPGVILAYLLNPAADSQERLTELERCITKLAVHETALFGAIKDGVFELLKSISPEAISKEENLPNGEDKSGGIFDRLMTSQEQARQARLWRRYREIHKNLMDGKHYQRRFVGREFARIYLRAMEKLVPGS